MVLIIAQINRITCRYQITISCTGYQLLMRTAAFPLMQFDAAVIFAHIELFFRGTGACAYNFFFVLIFKKLSTVWE